MRTFGRSKSRLEAIQESIDACENEDQEEKVDLEAGSELAVISLLNKSKLLLKLSDLPGALDCLKVASEIVPGSLSVLRRYAYLAAEARQFTLARDLYDRIVALDPFADDDRSEFNDNLMEVQKSADTMKGDVRGVPPFTRKEMLGGDDIRLRYALCVDAGNPRVWYEFEKIAKQREKLRMIEIEGDEKKYWTAYKLH